ncbi:hypothetical protein PILCRDRAFT_822685 [Piloderma croceum F 1598]|uniref:Uncharacterized protein n=1 Tax=Piloderma croceum (strain F 1598) TaxID=765440 RepID=A0A0C3F6C7_PILCF|nr:hypothetical protein PILCRDRAFT_822685 [Piloderma croceum F 1598]
MSFLKSSLARVRWSNEPSTRTSHTQFVLASWGLTICDTVNIPCLRKVSFIILTRSMRPICLSERKDIELLRNCSQQVLNFPCAEVRQNSRTCLVQVGQSKVGSTIRIRCGVSRNTALTVRSVTAARVDAFGVDQALRTGFQISKSSVFEGLRLAYRLDQNTAQAMANKDHLRHTDANSRVYRGPGSTNNVALEDLR